MLIANFIFLKIIPVCFFFRSSCIVWSNKKLADKSYHWTVKYKTRIRFNYFNLSVPFCKTCQLLRANFLFLQDNWSDFLSDDSWGKLNRPELIGWHRCLVEKALTINFRKENNIVFQPVIGFRSDGVDQKIVSRLLLWAKQISFSFSSYQSFSFFFFLCSDLLIFKFLFVFPSLYFLFVLCLSLLSLSSFPRFLF